jgi:16S rRNA G966 N2-methylase RsmD
MRNAGRLKLGFFPLPVAEGDRIREHLLFPDKHCSVVDPCVGAGAALLQVTSGADTSRYGIELDADRAAIANSNGVQTIHGNAMDTKSNQHQFSLLYLNPPYDFEMGPFANQRMEFLFLSHCYRWLVNKGVLVLVIPHKAIESCISILSSHFSKISVCRLQDPDSVKYRQAVVFAVHSKVDARSQETQRRYLEQRAWHISSLDTLEAAPQYAVPPTPPATIRYEGVPFDEVEDILLKSNSWAQIRQMFSFGPGVQDARPLTPLHSGHVGLLCTAGLLNGTFGEGENRHIARWRSIKHYDEKVEYDPETETKKTITTERFCNELALAYESGKVMLLTESNNDSPDIT